MSTWIDPLRNALVAEGRTVLVSVAATRGYQVSVADRAAEPGGMARIAARGAGRERLDLAWR